VVLQSCTVLPDGVPGCSATSVSLSNDAREVISIKVEDGTDIAIKQEEILVPITFATTKVGQDEVSYMSLYPLLHTFLEGQVMPAVLLSSPFLFVHIEFSTLMNVNFILFLCCVDTVLTRFVCR
jgi:hypothetical protein